MSDARFEDGGERPLKIAALDADDLNVISALVQDAVFPGSELAYDRKRRRFALLLNRFRWEHGERSAPERVQSVLIASDVLAVASSGVPRDAPETVFSLLALHFTPGEDGAGHLSLVLAGDGEIRLSVECLDVSLTDVTQPYLAPSRKRPAHPLEDT